MAGDEPAEGELDPQDAAVRTMMEARRVAVVGASPRPGSLGSRLVAGLAGSPSRPELHLVNPRYDHIDGLRCVPSLAEVPAPVDLVALAVGDASLEAQLDLAAARGDRSAVIFSSAFGDGRRQRLAATAARAGMALCGAGCMGFVNPVAGLRVVGYVEPDPLPAGPVALVTHSGSAFSALLRADRRIGWSLAVSSGQELVTSTADYLDYALRTGRTGVVALLLETLRDAARLRAVLSAATRAGVPSVVLAVGSSGPAREMVEAHSGALAGGDAAWEAICEATGAMRVRDLAEMADTLELLCAGRRPRARSDGSAGRIASVHDSGAERAHLVDVADRVGVDFARISPTTSRRLTEVLDDGLEAANPLDVWGTGSDATSCFAESLVALAGDPDTDLTLLCVDLVPEVGRDDSYEEAVADAWVRTDTPMAVLTNLPSAMDRVATRRLRDRGIPVLEGTESGLRAARHVLGFDPARRPAAVQAPAVDPERAGRWRSALGRGAPPGAAGGFSLLADYGIGSPRAHHAASEREAVAVGDEIGYPVVLKTDEPGIAHKSDVGGVVVGIANRAQLATAYREMSERLGPPTVVMGTAPPGVELLVGMVRDPLVGPLLVVGAGGVDAELRADRRVTLPPVSRSSARGLVDGLDVRPLLDGYRGRPAADLEALLDAVVGFATLVAELGEVLEAVEVNPLRCGPGGVLALDVLVIPRRPPRQD